MATNPNTTLLQAKDEFKSDKTPAQISGPAKLVSFAFKDIQPPSALYLDKDDQLVVECATSASNEVVTISARLLRPDGRIEDNQFIVRPLNTRAVLITNFSLSEGFLLSISALSNGASTRGVTWVRAFINRGAFGSGIPGQVLFADYATQLPGNGFPGGRISSPTESSGKLAIFTQANPAAGADFVIVVPNNTRWKIISLFATLTTSATVANRQPNIAMTIAGVGGFRGQPNLVVPASTIANLSASGAPTITALAATLVHVAIPPGMMVGQADTITSLTTNIQIGDQWSNIAVGVEEYLDLI